jgi:1-acyl-sn-glycerol-3-phosphate acyltransferase
MSKIFVNLYDFFQRSKRVFWAFFLSLVLAIGLGASQINIEEDITKFFPDDERVEKLNYVFRNSRFVERLVIMVSAKDSASVPQPDSLVAVADTLVGRIERNLTPYISKISSRVDEEKILEMINTVHQHLPVFLDDADYVKLDSIVTPENIKGVLEANYRQLISPAGVAMKRIIAQDPLGFTFLALGKLRQLQYDENFELYDGYIITKDHRHLIFFIEPVFSAAETGKNTAFIDELEAIVEQSSINKQQAFASFFGASAVAVGNAKQLRSDSILTISLMVVLLMIFLIGFFKKKRVPFLILIPVIFGGLFSLCFIYLIKGSVSILALAAGSVILGIAVNYSLHFLAHLKHTPDIKTVIKDLVWPLTIGSTTTVLAFFCLRFANAAVLRDVGLFAGFSLIGAALCALIFLPHLIPAKLFLDNHSKPSWIERLSLSSFLDNSRLVWIIFAATPVFFYFARQVNFNSDVGKLNFMTGEMVQAQKKLESINRSSLSAIYVVSTGADLQAALRKSEQVMPLLRDLKQRDQLRKYSTVSTFLISDSLQQRRIEHWNSFWTSEKKAMVTNVVRTEGSALKYSSQVLSNFERLINTNYEVADTSSMNTIRAAFFDEYIIEDQKSASVISLLNVEPSLRQQVYTKLGATSSYAFDRQMLTNMFVEYVNADFNFIVTFTAILVFVTLFISFGRIELTIITFAPMFITWIWILGLMALFNIEFNIVNVMVSTFIFGLGDDYSIFIMDGLRSEYQYGKKMLPSIRASIFLSAATTIAGLGVLIFAKHPALRSIASISIIGIVCVFIMSQTLEPFLFRRLITNRTRKGFTPMTWMGMLRTLVTYSSFVLGAAVLTVVGLLIRTIPFGRKKLKLFYHTLLGFFTESLLTLAWDLKVKIIGRAQDQFDRASIVIANHTSFLDILSTTSLHPKLILLTNKWVWNSPVMGGVVRLADYYPVSDGAEESVDRLSARMAEGYSVVIFPEGKRSEDGRIKRFHKGAFYLAETLNKPILPLLIHGAAHSIPKGTFYLTEGTITLKFLPRIEPGDQRFGTTYAERTKSISRYFREEFNVLSKESETPGYFSYRLITNYLYKGPVLEWYMRVKLRLEKNYAPFNDLIPQTGTVLDLGCGYGFLSYMLQFTSNERFITGVDYDEDKIGTANNGYLKTDRLKFFCADVTTFPLDKYDTIVVSDVLHYLKEADQDALLKRCFDALNDGGRLIIREGNADLAQRHKGTVLTEFFSVKLFGFNKSVNSLSFVSGERIRKLALSNGLEVNVIDDAKFTSNVIFVIQKSAAMASHDRQTGNAT